MSDEARDVDPDPDEPVADAALLQAVQLFREFAARPGYAFSDGETLANLRVVYGFLGTANAAYLGLVAELDSRPEALPGIGPGKTASTFLREALHLSGPQAGRDVRAAAAVASAGAELPVMGQALADGQVSREHLDAAVSTLRHIPQALKTKVVDDPDTGQTKTGAQVIDEVLTGQARQLPPSTVEVLGRQIVARLDPDRAERFDADAYHRRTYTWSRDFAGMGVSKFVLDPATDALVQAAITACSTPTPAGTATDPDGNTVAVKDDRTPGQRRADAVAALILTGAATHNQPATKTSKTTDQTTSKTTNDAPDQADQQTEPSQPETEQPQPHQEQPEQPEQPEAEQQGQPEQEQPEPPEPPDAEQRDAEQRDGERGPGRGLPVGVFAARPTGGVEVTVVTTLAQLLAAYGTPGTPDATPQGLPAGLARLSLAGPIGAYSGATLAPEVLARLTCDSPIRRILLNDSHAVLHHGRSQRLASPAQRRALAIRDNGCVIPGCHCPPEWCEAHHIIPWKDGGTTDIDAMALLCSRHHTAHHAGVYQIQMRDGIPWVRIPAWQDTLQPWLRNTTHHDHHKIADQIIRQLTEQPPLPWELPGDAA